MGEKIKDFATDDLSGLRKAKDYTRQNPGQAILVAAAQVLLMSSRRRLSVGV